MRVKLDGRGKSSGGRVIYYDTGAAIHMLMIYPKSVQVDITPAQKDILHKATRKIRKE